MSEKTNGQFNYRAFVSVLSGFTFGAMAVTGLVMFFAPSCRIARDTSWTIWGYSKEQWTAVHVWFSLAFVISSAFHIYLNWASLTCYFKSKLHKGFAFRTEWIAALVICGVIGLGTIYEVAPFSSLVVWKETFKHSESGQGAGGQGYRTGRGAGRLGQSTFDMPASTTAVRVSAQDSEQGITGSCGTAVSATGFGMGQKTLRQYCTEQGVELSWAISRLQSKGFTARETMTLRQIADSAGVHPRELRSILQSE